jgi:hypothetical protein
VKTSNGRVDVAGACSQGLLSGRCGDLDFRGWRGLVIAIAAASTDRECGLKRERQPVGQSKHFIATSSPVVMSRRSRPTRFLRFRIASPKQEIASDTKRRIRGIDAADGCAMRATAKL